MRTRWLLGMVARGAGKLYRFGRMNRATTGKNESPASLPEGATPTQLAAYTVLSRVLLNLDETITKE